MPSILVALLVNVPLVYLFVRAGEGGVDGLLPLLVAGSTLMLLTRTLLLAVGVVVVSSVLAVALAWLVVRTDLPARRLIGALAALPLVFPSYVAALALVTFLGPRGILQSWLEALPGVSVGELAYGYSGALLALSLFVYPYIYLLVVAALATLDPAVEESARSLGAGRWKTFFSVILPQLRPALTGGSLLVALYVLSDFGAVSLVRFDTFTLSIYNAYRALFDRSTAALLASLLVVLTLGLVTWEGRWSNRFRPVQRRRSAPPELVPLGRWRPLAVAFVLLQTAASLLLPILVLVVWGVRGLGRDLAVDAILLATWRSLAVACLAAVLAVTLSLPVVLWGVRRPSPWSVWVERFAYAGHALPGIVVALALVFVATRWLRPLYQTIPLLVAAYLVRFLPEAARALRSALQAVPVHYEESARILGRGPAEVTRTVTLPLIRPGLLVGAGLVFVTVIKELPATLILRPIGFETLATEIWSAADEGIYSQAAMPALLLVAVTAAPIYLMVIRPVLGGHVRRRPVAEAGPRGGTDQGIDGS